MENQFNIRGLRKELYYIGFARFIRATGRVSSFVFLPLVFIELYREPFLITGVIVGLATLLMAVVQSYSGRLTDRIGRRILMVIIPIPNVLAFFLMFLAIDLHLSVYLLLGAFYVTTLINALQFPALQAAIADLSPPEHRLSAYGMVRMMVNTGSAIGPLTGGFLATIGLQYIFLLASALTVVEIVVIYFSVPETYNFPTPQKKEISTAPAKSILSDRFFISFIIVGIIFVFFLRQNSISLSVYAVVLEKLPLLYLGYIYSVNGLVVVALQLPTLRLMTSRWSAMTWRGVGVLFYATAFSLLSISPTFTMIMIYMFTATIGENFISPTTQTIVTSLAPPDKKGTYIGTYSFFTSTGSFMGSALGLLLLSILKGIPAEFWIYISIGTFAVSMLYFSMSFTMRKRTVAADHA